MKFVYSYYKKEIMFVIIISINYIYILYNIYLCTKMSGKIYKLLLSDLLWRLGLGEGDFPLYISAY